MSTPLLPIRTTRFALLVVAAVVVARHPIGAATNSSGKLTEEQMVEEALHREIYGMQREREKLLNEAAAINANYGPAQWHRGFLRQGSQWVDVDSLFDSSQTPVMKEYLIKRDNLQDTVESHWNLATWCRTNKLEAQERAHLSRVLDLNSEHAEARERLGYRLVSGTWRTNEEIAANEARLAKQMAARNRWRSELLDIRRDLQHANPVRQAAARERLMKIQDIHAIPHMETLVSAFHQEGALAVIDAVSAMPGQEAIDSLIRHSVFSEWEIVREAAAEQLSHRKRESFVPAMLSEMYTPIVTQFNVSMLPSGRFGYQHAFQREGQEERQLLRLNTEYRRVRRASGNGEETLMRAFVDSFIGLAQREVATSQQNLLQSNLNQRIAESLNIATHQQLPPDPHRWWQWWDQENDMVQLGEKQLRARQQTQQVAIVDRPQIIPGTQSAGSQSGSSARAECFAAGTIVWTRTGAMPIEKVKVGDLVLAQDVETGELAFKPVLRTTIRPAGELVKLQIGRDEFQTSRGHLFWVTGHGWGKAHQLDSGMHLHCLRGAVPIGSVEAGGNAETYNLLVADFNTYFVGEERVLSHDVSLKKPTAAIVPGLKTE